MFQTNKNRNLSFAALLGSKPRLPPPPPPLPPPLWKPAVSLFFLQSEEIAKILKGKKYVTERI